MPLKHTRIEVSNAVFSLPYHVAKEKGYFADEGYDVELVPAGSGRDRDKDVPVAPIEDLRAVRRSAGTRASRRASSACIARASGARSAARRTAASTRGSSASARP